LYDRVQRRKLDLQLLSLLHGEASTLAPRKDVLIGVVPGAFYKDTRSRRGGQRILDIARRQGVRAERVPLHSFGSLADNAQILCDWLAPSLEG